MRKQLHGASYHAAYAFPSPSKTRADSRLIFRIPRLHFAFDVSALDATLPLYLHHFSWHIITLRIFWLFDTYYLAISSPEPADFVLLMPDLFVCIAGHCFSRHFDEPIIYLLRISAADFH